MKRLMLVVTIFALYLLHQDFWFWRKAEPFLFGILPVGLTYHVLYMLMAAGLMALLVRFAWPEDHGE